MKQVLIERPQYMRQLMDHKDKDIIKIVTGIRRCGKSSLLELFHEELLKEGIDKSHIIHMNLESLNYVSLKDYISFYKYVSELIPKKGKSYLIFDELQNVDGWQKAIESFRIDYDVDVYITGSNSFLLSSEFSTLLTGRYVEIKMLPLSFKEFLKFNEFQKDLKKEEKFKKYLQFGGMPIISEYNFNEPRCMQILDGIYSSIVMHDILERNILTDQRLLQKITTFLSSVIGSRVSINSIGNALIAQNDIKQGKDKAIAGNTVDKYISMLKSAYIFYAAERYDIKGKELLKTLGKYYIVDLGFRNMLLGYRDTDRGYLLENIVYLELLRRDYRVYIGKINEYEIDFVCEKPNEKIYIQVTESMNNAQTRDRELRPLMMIKDNYEKLVISMDNDFVSYDGIKNVNIIDWLLEE